MYYKEQLDVNENVMQVTGASKIESIWVEVKLHSQMILAAIMYRPPTQNMLFDELEVHLEKITSTRKNTIILGDLNADLMSKGSKKTEAPEGKKLLRCMNKFKLKNVIKQPTRVTDKTESLIDVSLVSDVGKVVKVGNFSTGIADHDLIYTVLNLRKQRSEFILKTVIDWKRCDVPKLKEEIKQAPWHSCNVFEDIDDNNWMMTSIYKGITNRNLPKRKAKVRKSSLPWMNSEIRKLINKRFKQLERHRRTKKKLTRRDTRK